VFACCCPARHWNQLSRALYFRNPHLRPHLHSSYCQIHDSTPNDSCCEKTCRYTWLKNLPSSLHQKEVPIHQGDTNCQGTQILPPFTTGNSSPNNRDKVVITPSPRRMPHAVEMPSFMAEDTGGMFSSSRPPFELPTHLRQSYEKVHGNARSSSHTSIKGSLGEGSDGFIDGEDVGNSQANGDMVHDGSLNWLPNGRSSVGSWDHKPSRNGSALSLNGAVNGAVDNEKKSLVNPGGGENGLPRTSNGDRSSVASTNGHVHNETIEAKTLANANSEPSKKISIPPPISTNPQSTGELRYTSSLLPATPLPAESPSRAATTSPHRFSSPPSYNPPPVPSPSSNSAQHPGSTQLKHRHTLQVPKAVPTRNSRDDQDTGFTTGKFSPTTLAAGVRRGSLSLNRRNTQSIHSNMPHEEIPPDEDALRWAEAVRQKRASKRKRKDEEDDDRVVVGTRVDQNHVNWVTAYNMLTGIRFTVSRTNAKMDRPLTEADFDARHKFSFDM